MSNEYDPECVDLINAMNSVPGIHTVESCCGHGEDVFRIFFRAHSLESLPPLIYWFDSCHSGVYGWNVIARTDCCASPVSFMVESTEKGDKAYEEASVIAAAIVDHYALE